MSERTSRRWVALTVVAETFEVDVAWLEEVVEIGLLGEVDRSGAVPAIEVTMLDRVARIHGLHAYQGLDLAALALWLGTPDPPPDAL